VWQDYLDALKTKIIAPWRETLERLVIAKLPYIERMVELERPGGLRTDAWSDELSRLLDSLSVEYKQISQQSADIAQGVFTAVNGVSHEQWYRIAKRVLGVDLFSFEPWIASESKAFIHENVDLIVKTESNVLSDISRVTMGGFREGKRWEDLKEKILGTDLTPGVFDSVETRAELIARDQTMKLYGDLAEKRQTSAGLSLYIWRTMEDERVVGTPGGKWPIGSDKHRNHWKMNGLVCRWDDATVYADSVSDALAGKWKKRTSEMPALHPGKEIQCRCYAEPVFDTLFTGPK
jgi:hypothetical protein